MIGPSVSYCGLLPALSHFVELVLEGRTPPLWRPFFFGANLTALRKKSGGIRPIAIGCTLRCLAAKVMGGELREEMRELLAPWQLGYGVRKGAEVTVHAASLYLHKLDPTKALLKLDFSNAFNFICRDKMFRAVLELAPRLFRLFTLPTPPHPLCFGEIRPSSQQKGYSRETL